VEFAVNRLFKGEAKPPAAAVLAELGKDVRPDYVTLLPEGHVEVTTSP
jgi:pyridoxine 5'-phosphate synthase PdxJ